MYTFTILKFTRRIEKEKQKFQAEVYDLLAQVEGAHKDKVKTCHLIFCTRICNYLI